MARIARPEEAERMRKLLVRAAYQAIAEKGFHAVTLQEVAQRAGVSKGLPLYYFPSKHALFASVMAQTVDAIDRQFERALRGITEPYAQLDAYLNTIILSASEHRTFYRVYLDFLGQGLRRPDFFRSIPREFILGCRVLERQIVTHGVASGAFRQDLTVDELTSAIRAMIDGFSIQWVFRPDERYETFRSQLHDAILRYLKAE